MKSKIAFQLIIIIFISISCNSDSSNTIKESEKLSPIEKDLSSELIKLDESNWVEREFKKQLLQTGKKDSIEIYGLPMDTLPDSFFDNQEIKYLNISCIEPNCMTTLSSKISKLKNLETLILAKTGIKKLPKEICQLKKIKYLCIAAGGDLEYLPKEIGELKHLEILDVWRNSLHELPESLNKLEKLKKIYVGENKFTKIYIKKLKERLPNVHIEIWR